MKRSSDHARRALQGAANRGSGQPISAWGAALPVSRLGLTIGPAAGAGDRPYAVTRLSPAVGGERAVTGESAAGIGSGPEPGEDPEEDSLVRRGRLEAVLLMAKSPLSTRKLAQLARLADGTEARTLVREVNHLYDSLGRALRVEQVAGGYRLMTRPALAPWLARVGHLPPTVRLSSPMMETLTVVAYRQPVSRADVEAVRGVNCGELLRQLLERDLIRIAGRGEELGRPYLYGTTKRFLQLFGLSGADALPPIRWQALREATPAPQADQSEQQAEEAVDPATRDSSTPPKESVVNTAVAPVVPPAESETLPILPTVEPDSPRPDQEVRAVIEDEEDEIYEGTDEDDDEEEEGYPDDLDEDWDEEEDDLEEDDLEEDEEDLDDEEDEDASEWVEVGDEDADEDWDDDEEDDEDWDEDDDDEEEDWD